MNAKKIMGAVLVALLAAALFVGAGAATLPTSSTVFVNQALPSDYSVDWIGSNGAFDPSFDPVTSKYYFPAGSEGVYTYEPSAGSKYTVTVTALKATISAFAGSGIYAYPIIGSTYFQESGDVNVVIGYAPTLTGTPVYSVYMTTPDYADKLIVDQDSDGVLDEIEEIIQDGKVGDYSIVVAFNATDFVTGTLYTDLFTAPVSFKIAEAGAATIAASADQALKSEDVKITITGQPGAWYKVFYEANAFEGAANQMGLPGVTSAIGGTGFYFQMPNTGSVNFAVNGGSIDADSAKMNVQRAVANNGALDTDAKKATVTIKFLKGTITAEADAASYFVGDKITISGTNNAGTIKGYSVKGTNFEAVEENFNAFTEGTPSSKNFEFEINTADLYDAEDNKKVDVGTYTVTLFVGSMTNPTAKATVAVVLKQPFISIVDAPEVIVQDTKAEFVINAEAVKVNNADAPYIAYYIFGTNYFKTGAGIQDDEVKTNYIVTLNEDTTDNMSAGQYFAVFQHPMYDGVFNVTGNQNSWWISVNGDETINVKNRQTANAAQALCDALDIQTIDDMYVKYSFFVIGEDESFTISDIPSKITKGSTFTISGVATSKADEFVTVEMISTAFAAVPKETVGSAAFIAVTTQIAEDGTWEVTFDTSDLNVDEYSLKVACGDDTWKNVNVNVVAAEEKPDTPVTPEQPEQPEQPEEPVAPATPGFGALAALAGLGAVAVLLLRRE